MQPIAQVRRFNRIVTQQVGALEGGFLGRKRSLGACRLLFEIGTDVAELRHLRTRLGLDSGYASRLLRGLEREGLVRTKPSPNDARARYVSLTAAGKRELTELNRLSDRAAGDLLKRLTDEQRAAMLDAMGTVERLLVTSAVRLSIEDPAHPDAQYCLRSYFNELGERFDTGFDPMRGISADPEELTPPKGYFVIARLNDEPVGCGALKCHAEFAEVKRMWVTDAARGFGMGKRILQRLEEIARERHIPLLRLETNKTLVEAQSLYKSSGYREVPRFNDEPYAHHWFEKEL